MHNPVSRNAGKTVLAFMFTEDTLSPYAAFTLELSSLSANPSATLNKRNDYIGTVSRHLLDINCAQCCCFRF